MANRATYLHVCACSQSGRPGWQRVRMSMNGCLCQLGTCSSCSLLFFGHFFIGVYISNKDVWNTCLFWLLIGSNAEVPLFFSCFAFHFTSIRGNWHQFLKRLPPTEAVPRKCNQAAAAEAGSLRWMLRLQSWKSSWLINHVRPRLCLYSLLLVGLLQSWVTL